MSEIVQILIVDDHPILRDGLVAILSTQPDFTVVAEAASGEEALRIFPKLVPDVILLDLEMPGMDGVQAIHRLRQ
jgi:YesN/AraC family two-component response regulator